MNMFYRLIFHICEKKNTITLTAQILDVLSVISKKLTFDTIVIAMNRSIRE